MKLKASERPHPRDRIRETGRIISITDLNRVDETRGNITVEEGNLMVNEKHIDRQTCGHHVVTKQNAPQETPEFLSGHNPAHREPTQPQNMIRQMTPLYLCWKTPANGHPKTTTLQLTSQQQPTTSAILKPASTSTSMFDGKNKKVELFETSFKQC